MILENLPSYMHQIDARGTCDLREFFAYLMGRGTGKTKTAIDEMMQLYLNKEIVAVLIIAPNDVHNKWITEQFPLHLHPSIKSRSIIWSGQTSKKAIKELQALFEPNPHVLTVLSINIEAFSSERGTAVAFNFCKTYKDKVLIILDESTRIKNPSTKRTKNVLKLTKVSKYRRILTGNEITKTPFEVYSQFKFLSADFWDIPYHAFKNRYGEYITQHAPVKKLKNFSACKTCHKTTQPIVKGFMNRKLDHWDVEFNCSLCDSRILFQKSNNNAATREALRVKESQGRYPYKKLVKFKKLNELKAKLAPHSFRVRKRDALPDLPAKIYSPIYTSLSKEQQRIYDDLKVELFSEYNNDQVEVTNKIALMVRFQQITGGFFPGEENMHLIGKSSPKMDRLLYDLEDVDDEAIIIWSVFRPEIVHIQSVLQKEYPNDRSATFYGGIPKKERPQIITDFQQGDIRFLIANPSVAGTGLNLQRSRLHYYYSNTCKAEDRWQSEDRSHRSGQTNHVVYKDIIIKGTVDDSIHKILKGNLALNEFFKRPMEEIV